MPGGGGPGCSFFWESREEVCPRVPPEPRNPKGEATGSAWFPSASHHATPHPRACLLPLCFQFCCTQASSRPLTLQAQADLRAFALAAPRPGKLCPWRSRWPPPQHLAAFSASASEGLLCPLAASDPWLKLSIPSFLPCLCFVLKDLFFVSSFSLSFAGCWV